MDLDITYFLKSEYIIIGPVCKYIDISWYHKIYDFLGLNINLLIYKYQFLTRYQ